MDLYMETKLDGLYYRTPATPGVCGPYKNATTYNGCSFLQGRNTQAPSRTDYTKQNLKLNTASDSEKFRQLLNYPNMLNEIVGESESEQIRFINKFPVLKDVLKNYYPKLVASASAVLEKYENLQVEDARVKMLINGPHLFDYVVGKSEQEKIDFIKKNFDNKNLVETLGKYYPKIVKKALSESYGVY
jgi:hypothetical protein